ncbi:MAG: sigma-70 family RNA polymerase sigma factor [Acidobacteriota bacterium]
MLGRPRTARTAHSRDPARIADCPDDELVAELRAGNQDAFAAVFARYHKLVYSTALRFLRDAGEAEDLMQSVFFEAFQKLGQFDPARGTLKMWLLQFAYGRSINRRNYLMVRRLHAQGPRNEGLDELAPWSSSHAPTQEASRLSHELLRELPDAQRATIEMVFFEGLTFTEIAERRQEGFSAVRHHYYRGLTRLRDVLAGEARSTRGRQGGGVLHEVKRARA